MIDRPLLIGTAALLLGASTLLVAPERLALTARTLAARAGAVDYPRVSPFEALRWQGETPEVRVGGRWYRLVALDGHTAAEIVAAAKSRHHSRWEKRVAEDLFQVLAEMGAAPRLTCDLDLVDLETGAAQRLEGVRMTEANRTAIWRARNEGARGPVSAALARVRRVEREHATRAEPAYGALAEPLILEDGPPLARELACADLAQLEALLEDAYSYRDLRGVDWPAAVDALRLSLPDPVPAATLALGVRRLLALAGDGHSGPSGAWARLPGPYLPCLVFATGGRAYAVRPDRSDFVDPQRPLLVALDGVPLETWLAAAAQLEAVGSPQFVERHARRDLRHPALLRRVLRLPESEHVALRLARADGSDARDVRLPLSPSKPLYGSRLPDGHRRLEGDVGYLRIGSMDGDRALLEGLDAAMAEFRDTRGLVIDVRENGGGTRDALRRLLPYFLDPAAGPRVVNVAAYRLGAGEAADAPEGYLENRSLHPRASRRHDAAARAAIDAVLADFEPDWELPAGAFSDWHFMLVRAADNPAAYRYERPVVLLIDAGCFSATDIFVGGFAGLDGVTLLGTATGGGSGRTRGHVLAHSGLELRLSSMASFRPDGRRYDGLGVAPDVVVEPAPEDFLQRSDAQLAAALARLTD